MDKTKRASYSAKFKLSVINFSESNNNCAAARKQYIFISFTPGNTTIPTIFRGLAQVFWKINVYYFSSLR